MTTPDFDLQRTFERSISDLASLRMKGVFGIGELPAAGMPWFMTLFGRDTLITSLQTLALGTPACNRGAAIACRSAGGGGRRLDRCRTRQDPS